MLTTPENRPQTVSVPEQETAEHVNGEVLEKNGLHSNGTALTIKRLDTVFSVTPSSNGEESHPDERPVLAMFCYEDPSSAVGQYVGHLASALARRSVAVHLFSRTDFDLNTPEVTRHVLGEGEGEGELLDQVQEFTSRACNAFLRQFQGASIPITLFGQEWTAAGALSILRGIKNLPTLLSLQSLERQRSDMSSDVSREIDEIELKGLREAKVVYLHDPATGELARSCVPECAGRIEYARQPFPIEQFNSKLDPGEVKARYQVGPCDPTVLYIGDLDERYGPDLLVKAMPGILKNKGQVRLIVVGDGTLLWPLRVYARYLLLEHAVRLVGNVEGQALHELIQSADVIAVPSREATPWWPILAGWAARRPVVATHNAAVGLLEHEKDSVLFYPSENSCVWGIERVLFDPGLGQSIGQRGQQKLEERFGWNSVAVQVEELMGVPLSV
jgi:glycosyltransferase involved in cell wall biosynthesis